MKDLKYLIAYLAPAAAFVGIYFGGWLSFGSLYIGFVLIPILEIFTPGSSQNFSQELEAKKSQMLFFDILLYLNIPILLGLIYFFLITITSTSLSTLEYVGMTLNVGLVVSTIGINVAHELGHRTNPFDQIASKLLLLTALYMHFNIEHNRGHHKNVGTDEDPASAKANETLYGFWIRSILGGYLHAWKIENKRLRQNNFQVWTLKNEMIRFTIIQILYLVCITLFFGLTGLMFAVLIAMEGVILLESINYVEHYGLRRKKLQSGFYEQVMPRHSWNSNHEMGRIFLYELTRHSDHHYKSNRKFQVLRHMDESPQLPYGYPSSIIIALLPPVWFHLMNGRVLEWQQA